MRKDEMNLKKTLYLIGGIFFISLFTLTIINYKGNSSIYIIFTLVSFFYPIHSIVRKTFFLDTFLSVFIWLGFWFKFSLSLAFYDSIFPEGLGKFDHHPDSYDKVLILSSFSIFLLIIFSIFANYFSLYPSNTFKKKHSLSNFYKNYKKRIISLFLFVTFSINIINYIFGIHQKGIISEYKIHFIFIYIVKWMLMIGLPTFGIMILTAELYLKRNVNIFTYLIVLSASFISNISMMSRAMIFNSSFILYGLWRTKNKEVRKMFFKFLTFLLLFSILSIFISHHLRLQNVYITEDKTVIQNNDQEYYKPKIFLSEVVHLIRARFIGIDSLMAVVSHKNLSNEILINAFNEEANYEKYNFYYLEFHLEDEVSNGSFNEKVFQENVYSVLLPGFISFSYYSGSMFVMGFLLFIFYSIGIIIEYLAYKFSRQNFIFASFVAGLVAYRLMHFGYVPKNSYSLIFGIFLSLFMVYVLELIIIKFYTKFKK